jgi:hypothetical protein
MCNGTDGVDPDPDCKLTELFWKGLQGLADNKASVGRSHCLGNLARELVDEKGCIWFA